MRCWTAGGRVDDLTDDSPHGPVRTAEDVPGAPGDTPRVLGRSGPAPALRPVPRAAAGAEPTGLPPRERGVAAGRRPAPAAAGRTDHHRTSMPYAPAAPAFPTAGPAAPSSSAAGPATRPPRPG
ncbi:hypothetical protein ACGFNU_40335 [Spirillospora sp. NPDC048911]|uniref:hypothetical protein n=1 Tax=Spirillospora sp. NPDC048911 TaxID=3364527 RepID=UPI0037233DA0